MNQKKYIIYVHINKINGKIYIGQTSQTLNQRCKLSGQGYKGCPKFWNGINKYGWDNFMHIIIFSDLNKEMADILEDQLIVKYDSVNNGYNLKTGGSSGFELSKETKQKMRKSKTGKNNPMYSKRHSKEIQEKINESNKGKLYIKVINLITNKIYDSLTIASTETTDCIATISKHCNNSNISNRHWMFYDEYLKIDTDMLLKMMNQKNVCSKSVISLDTYIIYESASKAEIETNTNSTLICRHCKNMVKNPRWMYHDEYLNKVS